MNTSRPVLIHASTERLCDYELSELQSTAPSALPPPFPDLHGGGNPGLAWWLWMNEVGHWMMRPYDHWRANLEAPAQDGAGRSGKKGREG